MFCAPLTPRSLATLGMTSLALAIFSVTLQVVVAAQESQPLSETIDGNGVTVDGTVLDRHRNPVRALTAGDFEEFECGKPQNITNLHPIEAAEPRVQGSATA